MYTDKLRAPMQTNTADSAQQLGAMCVSCLKKKKKKKKKGAKRRQEETEMIFSS